LGNADKGPTPDGLQSPAIEDLSWIKSNCDSSQMSVSYESPRMDITDSISLSFLPANMKVVSAHISRQMQASLVTDGTSSFDISMSLDIILSGPNETSSPTSLTVVLSKQVQTAGPVVALSSLPVSWRGSLITKSDGGAVIIQDLNLFDGVLPAVVFPSDSGASVPTGLLATMQSLMSNLIVRLDAMASMPTSISDVSVRSAFDVSALPSPSNPATINGVLANDNANLPGVVYQARGSCADSSCHPNVLAAIRDGIVAGIAKNVCNTLDLVPATLTSEVTIDMFVGTAVVIPRGFSAITRALFACNGDAGYVGVEISTTSANEVEWPLSIYMNPNDVNAAVGMTKSLNTVMQGSARGLVTVNGTLFTIQSPNLFGSISVDRLTPDSVLQGMEQVSQVAEAVLGSLTTGNPVVDYVLKDALWANFTSLEVLTSYTESVHTPTLLGYLQWFFNAFPSVYQLSVRPELNDVAVSLAITQVSQSSIPFNADWMPAASVATQSLCLQLQARFAASTSNYTVINHLDSTLVPNVLVSSHITTEVRLNGLGTGDVTAITQGIGSISVIANINAQFDSISNPIISHIQITWDAESGRYSAVAHVSKRLSAEIELNVVGIDDSDLLYLDGSISLPRIQNGFDEVRQNITKFLTADQDIRPIQVSREVATGVTWIDVMDDLHGIVSTSASSATAYDIFGKIVEYFEIFHPSEVAVFPALRFDEELGLFSVNISIRRFQFIGVDDDQTQWSGLLDTSRLSVPAVLDSHLDFTIASDVTVINSFVYQSIVLYEAWTLPVLYGMQSGFATTGSLQIDLNFGWGVAVQSPTTLDISVTAYMSLSDVLTLKIEGRDIGAPSESFDVDIGGDIEKTVFPAEIQQGVNNVLLRGAIDMLNGALAVSVPPLTETLAKNSSLDAKISRLLPWLNTPASFRPRLLSSRNTCVNNMQGTLSLSMVVNKIYSTECLIEGLNTASLTDWVRSVNNRLAECQNQAMIRVEANAISDDLLCGRVDFFPAVNGMVWSLELTISGDIQLSGVSSQLDQSPVYGCWGDLNAVLQGLFGNTSSLWNFPKLVMVPVDSVANLIPTSMKTLYPSHLPAMVLDFHMDHSEEMNRTDLRTSWSTTNDEVAMTTSDGAGAMTLTITTNTTYGAVFGVPPGAGIFAVQSNLVSMDDIFMPVPSAPNNTFIISVEGEFRQIGDSIVREFKKFQTRIELTPGKPLLEAFQSDFISQLESPLPLVLTVVKQEGSSILKSCDQIRLSVAVTQVEPNLWYVPWRLSIQESTLVDGSHVLLGNTSIAPSRVSIVFTDLEIEASGQLQSNFSKADGRLGIVDSGVRAASGDHNLKLRSSLTSGFHSFAGVRGSLLHDDSFINRFTALITVNGSLSISQFDFRDTVEAGVNVSEDGVISLWIQNHFVVNRDSSVQSLVDRTDLIKYDFSFHGSKEAVHVLGNIVRLNTSSPCSWLSLWDSVNAFVVTQQEAGILLPFASHSFASIFEDMLVNVVKDLQYNVCSMKQPMTLAVFCAIAKDALHHEICTKSTLHGNKLVIYLEVEKVAQYSSSFVFDTSRLLDAPDLPIGLGASDQLTLMGRAVASVELVADFSDGGFPVLSLGNNTRVGVEASFDTSGKLFVWFGAQSLTFGSAKATLGSPASISLHLTGPLTLDQTSEYDPDSGAGSKALKGNNHKAIRERKVNRARRHRRPVALPRREISTTNKMDLSLDLIVLGKANLYAALQLPGLPDCSIEIDIPALGPFLLDPANRTVITPNCGNFTQALESLFVTDIMGFFDNPERFIDQMEGGISNLVENLLTEGLNELILPLVDNTASFLIKHDIITVIDRKALQTALTNMLRDVILHRNSTSDKRELTKVLLELLTEVMFEHLPLWEKPPVPNVDAEQYRWKLKMGRRLYEKIAKIGFDIGAHGIGEFELKNCQEQLEIGWNVTMTLVYDQTHGFSLEFADTPLMEAHVQFSMTGGKRKSYVNDCILSGNLAFLGAQLDMHGGVIASIQVIPPQFTEDEGYEVIASIEASLEGLAELGFAGPLVDAILEEPNSIAALPHWQVDNLALHWDWQNNKDAHTPDFHFGNVSVCIGHMLGHVVNDVLGKPVRRVLEPLIPIFGPDGFLLQRISVTKYILGREMTLVEVCQEIVKSFCDSDCDFENVMEALEVFQDIIAVMARVIEIANQMEGRDICAVGTRIQDFVIDFRSDSPQPQPTGTPVPQDMLFFAKSDEDKQVIETFYEITSGTQGSFGVHFTIFDHVSEDLIKLILGVNFPIVEVTLPKLVISAHAIWRFIIWDVPIVELVITAGASLVGDVGKIQLLSNGIRDAVVLKKPSRLWSAIGVPADHWPFVGQFTLGAGIAVGIFIFDVTAMVQIMLQVMARIRDSNHDGYITFDEIWWLIGSGSEFYKCFELQLDFMAMFELQIHACIWLPFSTQCWTIVSWETPWYTIATLPISAEPFVPTAVTGPGVINMDAVNWHYESGSSRISAILHNNDQGTNFQLCPLSFTSNGNPCQNEQFPVMDRISFSGLLDMATELEYLLINTTSQIITPHSENLNLIIDIASHLASTIRLSPSTVTMDTAPGAQISACRKLDLVNSLPESIFSLQGVACALSLLSVASNNISVSGTADQYKGAVSLDGPCNSLNVLLEETQYTISSSSIKAGESFELSTPNKVLFKSVTGHATTGTTFTLTDIDESTRLNIVGQSGNDNVVLDMQNIKGNVNIDLGSGLNNRMDLDVISSGKRLVATASRYSFSQTSGKDARSISHHNVQTRIYHVIASPESEIVLTLLRPEDGANVFVKTFGVNTATINVPITGCDPIVGVTVEVTGGGEQIVELGNNEVLDQFLCPVFIAVEKVENQTVTVVIGGSLDSRKLEWHLSKGSLWAVDDDEGGSILQVVFSDIDRIVIRTSRGGGEFRIQQDLGNTELIVNFQPNTTSPNFAFIASSTSPILLHGTMSAVTIGPELSRPDDTPLSMIRGMIAISSTNEGDPTTISIVSAAQASDVPVAQVLRMDDRCVSNALSNGTAFVPTRNAPSLWFCNQIAQAGFTTVCPNCHVAYNGNVFLNIATGDADDVVIAEDVNAPFKVELNDGDDRAFLLRTYEQASLDLGPGWDKVILYNVYGSSDISLGDDVVEDIVNIYSDAGVHPGIYDGSTIKPVSSDANSLAVLAKYRSQDRLVFIEGVPTVDLTPNPGPSDAEVIIHANGENTFNLNNNTIFHILSCASHSHVVFKGKDLSSGIYPPVNWTVLIDLQVNDGETPFSTACTIEVFGLTETNGTVTLRVPDTTTLPIELEQTTSVSGAMSVGHLNVKLESFDILKIEPVDAGGSNTIVISVDNVPCNSDLVVYGTLDSNIEVQLKSLASNVLLKNVETSISYDILASLSTVITTGHAAQVVVNCSACTNVSLVDGCLNSTSTQYGSLSPLMLFELAKLGISPQNCPLICDGIDSLKLSAANIAARNIDVATEHLMILDGSIDIIDDSIWSSPILNGTIFSVDERYSVELSKGHFASLDAFLSPSAVLDIIFHPGSPGAVWQLGDRNDPVVVEWEADTSVGQITSRMKMSTVRLFGSGDVDFVVNLFRPKLSHSDNNLEAVHRERTVHMGKGYLHVHDVTNDTSIVNFNVTFPESLVIQSTVTVTDLFNSIILDEEVASFGEIPVLRITESASASLLPMHSSVLLPTGKVRFDANNYALQLKDRGEGLYCLAPNMCEDDQWVSVAVYGPYRCQREEDLEDCQAEAAVILDTPHDIYCDPSGADSNAYLVQPPPNKALHQSSFILDTYNVKICISVLYFVSVILAVWMWCTLGTVCNEMFLPLILTGALSGINHNDKWSAMSRAVVESSREIVDNFYSGWYCGDGGVNNNSPAILSILAIIMAFLLAFWASFIFIGIRFTSSLGITWSRRIISGVLMFMVLPVAFSHVTSKSHADNISVIILSTLSLIAIMFDAWHFVENSPRFQKSQRWNNCLFTGLNLAWIVIVCTTTHPNVSEAGYSLLAPVLVVLIWFAGASVGRVYLTPETIEISPLRKRLAYAFILIGNIGFGIAFIVTLSLDPNGPSALFLGLWIPWAFIFPVLTLGATYGSYSVRAMMLWLNNPIRRSRTRVGCPCLPFWGGNMASLKQNMLDADDDLQPGLRKASKGRKQSYRERTRTLEARLRQMEEEKIETEETYRINQEQMRQEINNLRELNNRYIALVHRYESLPKGDDNHGIRDQLQELVNRIGRLLENASTNMNARPQSMDVVEQRHEQEERQQQRLEIQTMLEQLEAAVRGSVRFTYCLISYDLI
jgi:hypothetical protein